MSAILSQELKKFFRAFPSARANLKRELESNVEMDISELLRLLPFIEPIEALIKKQLRIINEQVQIDIPSLHNLENVNFSMFRSHMLSLLEETRQVFVYLVHMFPRECDEAGKSEPSQKFICLEQPSTCQPET